jgi:hypothetical protein
MAIFSKNQSKRAWRNCGILTQQLHKQSLQFNNPAVIPFKCNDFVYPFKDYYSPVDVFIRDWETGYIRRYIPEKRKPITQLKPLDHNE